MTVKLFQDAGGTIPAVLAGQPVGFIKRTKGSDDAKQATALSKPTYARWPRTGKKLIQNRNVWDTIPLGVLNSAYSNSGFLVRQGTDGVVTEIIERGRDVDGLPYLIVNYTGQNNHASNIQFLNIINDDVVPIPADKSRVYSSALVTLIDGFLGNSSAEPSLQPYANFRDGGGQTITGNSTYVVLEQGVERVVSVNSGVPVNAVSVINRGLYIRVPVGEAINATVKIKAMKASFEGHDVPFQTVVSPNDITEIGVPDSWHLYNDGGDSLNVTLPAGTYGLATIGIDRQIDIGTFVSDGTTPVNILRHERQLDVSYRFGAYSAAEELAIRDAWGRKYA